MGNIDIRYYRSLFLRRLPQFLGIVAICTIIGVIVAFSLPRVYRADARIMVESPQIAASLLRSSVPADIIKQFQMIELQMMTRSNLLDLAKKMNLYSDVPNASDSDIVDDMRSRMSIEQILVDTPRGNEGAMAFSVSFKSKDPVIAADVVNEFVKLIVQKSVTQRSEQASQNLQFFQQEAERLGTRLTQYEAEILAFKNQNGDALPESLSFRRSQQITQQERLMQLSREEATLREGRTRLTQMFAGTGRVTEAAMTPSQRTLEQLRRVLSEQRTVFAENSPGIVALQAQIASLEKAAQAERGGAVDTAAAQPGASELDIQLADIDRRLQLIQREKAAAEASLSSLTASIAATPANETALTSLERQYQNAQAQYTMATSRLADATTGQRIEQVAKGERLSVLELASPPERPAGPRRIVAAIAGLFAGIGLGVAFIVLMEFLNRSIRRPMELVEALQIEPLAVIPYITAGSEANSNKMPTLRRVVGI